MDTILSSYWPFALKCLTTVVTAAAILTLLTQSKKHAQEDDISFVNLSKKRHRKIRKWQKDLAIKTKKDKEKKDKPRLFVLHFTGDIKASGMEKFGQQVDALLNIAQKERDQVLIKLTSAGGQVSPYGLGAAHIMRLRNAGLYTHVVIDTVAASGGYLMAAMANRITAAPFATLGSIGVILQMPNLYEWMKEKKLHVEQITAGGQKRNLTFFTHNSEDDRHHAQMQVNKIHDQFIEHIQTTRPNIKKEATQGDVFLAQEALQWGLIDALGTSNACIDQAHQTFTVWEIPQEKKKSRLKNMLSTLSTHMLSLVQPKMP